MSKKDKNKDENNIINNSVYSKSLNRLLDLYKHYSKDLENEINYLKKNISGYYAFPFLIFTISLLILIITMIATNGNEILSTIISGGLFISSIPFSIIKTKKNKQILNITNNKLDTIEIIIDYLKSELEISKEYKNLLSNAQILEKENIHHQQLDSILNNTTSLDFLNHQYLEEYHKNLIISDSLKDLNDQQKEIYLKKIYNQIDTDLTTKTNINFNDNNNENSMQNNNSQSSQKPFSLKKADDAINDYNELNEFFTYQQNEDILPPKAQEELKKGHQFSKKFPK